MSSPSCSMWTTCTTRRRARGPAEGSWPADDCCAHRNRPLLPGLHPVDHRNEFDRRRAQHHPSLAGLPGGRRTRCDLQPVVRQDGGEPRRESTRHAAVPGPRRHGHVQAARAPRGHTTRRSAVRCCPGLDRRDCRTHGDERRVCIEVDGYLPRPEHRGGSTPPSRPAFGSEPAQAIIALRRFGDRLASATGLETVIDTSLESIDDLLGHGSSLLLVYQSELDRLVTLASRGYDSGGVGSEVVLGEGVIGMAAARQRSMRIGNLQRMLSYAKTVQRAATGDTAGHDEIRLPGLADAGSQMAAPLIAGGVLLGVLAVESRAQLAYDEQDENVFAVAAHLVASALEREELSGADAVPADAPVARPTAPDQPPSAPVTPQPVVIRHYAVDGSTFLDDDYVIKGVAGRLLWKVIFDYSSTGRTAFTNREVKLDPVLGLPPYRDNFESRLVLLKRRLDERDAPLRIVSTGRGRFELVLSSPVVLHHIEA